MTLRRQERLDVSSLWFITETMHALALQAAKSDKGEGSDAVQAEAARLEAEAKELEEVLLWAKDNSSDPTLMEVQLPVLMLRPCACL